MQEHDRGARQIGDLMFRYLGQFAAAGALRVKRGRPSRSNLRRHAPRGLPPIFRRMEEAGPARIPKGFRTGALLWRRTGTATRRDLRLNSAAEGRRLADGPKRAQTASGRGLDRSCLTEQAPRRRRSARGQAAEIEEMVAGDQGGRNHSRAQSRVPGG